VVTPYREWQQHIVLHLVAQKKDRQLEEPLGQYPNEFLLAVENAINASSSPFDELFDQELCLGCNELKN
jgi:hypothetical protein